MNELLSSIHENRKHLRTVDIGEMVVTNDPDDTIVTFALGSCIGVTAFDPRTKTGGMIHCKFASAGIYPERANIQPSLFVDTGIPALLQALYAKGVKKNNLIVKLAGASVIYNDSDMFRIGQTNYETARKILQDHRIPIHAEEVGGNIPRTVYLNIRTGKTLIRSKNQIREL